MIGIISDTHDNVDNILKAVEVFNINKCSIVIHLGDIVAPATVMFFKGLNMQFILGNCDGDIFLIKKKIEEIGGTFLEQPATLNIDGSKIALIHGHDEKKLKELVESQKYDYVLHGHTHKKKREKIGKTEIINPGAHYYKCENTIALLDLENDKLEFVKLK